MTDFTARLTCHVVDLADVVKQIAEHGPTRVLCRDGSGRSPKRVTASQAAEFAGRYVIFVRDDGWSLGCSSETEAEGFMMWRHDWVAFAVKGSFGGDLRPISEYKGVSL